MSEYIPNKYTDLERKVIDDFHHHTTSISGYNNSSLSVVTIDAVKLWANAVDYWNPLFSQESYAEQTKYEGLIAAPFFSDRYLAEKPLDLFRHPELGMWRGYNDGGDADFYLPIRPGDVFRVWRQPQTLEDITEEGGEDRRVFRIVSRAKLVNQQNDTVASLTCYFRNVYSNLVSHAEKKAKPPWAHPPHQYSDDEWLLIREVESKEKVCGRMKRYWNEVSVGDEPAWVIAGPTTVLDMIRIGGLDMMSLPPIREIMRQSPESVFKSTLGTYHVMEEMHFTDAGNRGRNPVMYQSFGRSLMARLLTNYIGDDGWLKRLSWRNDSFAEEITDQVEHLKGRRVAHSGQMGDTLISKAEVKRKYKSGGECLLDVVVWCEDITGTLSQAAIATVSLPEKS